MDADGDRAGRSWQRLGKRPALVIATTASGDAWRRRDAETSRSSRSARDAWRRSPRCTGRGMRVRIAELLVERSGGIAAARAPARRANGRGARPPAAAGGGPGRRRAVRAARAEIELRRATLPSSRPCASGPSSTRADDGVVCPFKGLASFEVDDARRTSSGASGSSARWSPGWSARRCSGVVGAVRERQVLGGARRAAARAGRRRAARAASEWAPGRCCAPGEHPLRDARAAPRRGRAAGERARRVDQFEEVFTLCRDEAERARVPRPRSAARAARRRRVVVAVRADFYGRCAELPASSPRLLGANHVLVGPMRRDELRRAIERPARARGLRVEPELVDRAGRRRRARSPARCRCCRRRCSSCGERRDRPRG